MKKSQLLNFFRVTLLLLIFSAFTSSAWAATITGGTKLYLKPNSNWSQSNARFAVYLFTDGGAAKWYSMSDGDADGIYSTEVQAGESYEKLIFCRMNPSSGNNEWGNRWNSTCDLTYDGTNNYYNMSSSTNWGKGNNDDNCEDLTNDNKWSVYSSGGDSGDDSGDTDDGECKTLYLKPNVSDWSKGDERYVAYFFKNDVGHTWANMEESSCSGIYKVAVPDIDLTSVIFVRMDGGSVINSWDKKWDQTEDLTIGANKLFTISYKDSDKWKGSWSSSSCTDKAECYTCKLNSYDETYLQTVTCNSNNTKIIFRETFTFTDDQLKENGEKSRIAYSVSNDKYSAGIPSYDAMTKPCSAIKDGGYYAMLVNPKYAGWGDQQNGKDDCNISGHRWYRSTTDKKSDGKFEITEHTGDTNGGMLLFNCKDGSSDKCMPDVLYECVVNDICKNTYINFSAYITRANTGEHADKDIKAEFRLLNPDDNNKVLAVRKVAGELSGDWSEISGMFNSGDASRVKIQLVNTAPDGIGNDILLDDITFSVCSPQAALVFSGTTSSTSSISVGESKTLDASITSGLMTDSWYIWQSSTDNVNWSNISTTPVQVDVNSSAKLTVKPSATTYYRAIVANSQKEAQEILKGHDPSACGMYAITNIATLDVTINNLELTYAITDDDICVDGVDATTLTLTVKNPRLVDVTDVEIKLENITDLKITKVSGTGTYLSGVWTVGNLTDGATASIVLKITSNASVSAQISKVIVSYVSTVDNETYASYENAPADSKKQTTLQLNPLPAPPTLIKNGIYDECAKSGTVDLSTLATGTSLKFYSDAALTNTVTTYPLASEAVNNKEYYVTQTDDKGCTSPAAKISVTVKENPTLNSITVDKDSICKDESTAKLTYNISGGAAPYKLEIKRTENSKTETINATNLGESGKSSVIGEYTLNPSSDATYKFVKVTDKNNCSSESSTGLVDDVKINVTSLKLETDLQDETICADKKITYNITASGDDIHYKWYESIDNGVNYSVVGEDKNEYTTDEFEIDDTKKYKVVVYQESNVCSSKPSKESAVIVQDCSNLSLTSDITGGVSSVCKGDEITLNYSITNNAEEDAQDVIVTITGLSKQTLKTPITGYDHSTGIWNVGTLGKGKTAKLSITIKGSIVVKDDPIVAYISKSGSTTYDLNAPSTIKVSKTITVKKYTDRPTLIPETYKGCRVEEMLNLDTQIETPTDKSTLKFYTDESRSTDVKQANKATVGTTTYYVTNTLDGECESDTTQLKIVVFPQPTAKLTGDTTICKGFPAYLAIELSGTTDYTVTYTANVDGTKTDKKLNEISDSKISVPVYPTETTTYSLKEVKDGNECPATISGGATVTVNNVPTIKIGTDAVLPADICAGQKYQLPSVTVTNNGSDVTSEGWYLGATKISLGEGKYSYSGGTKITLDEDKYYTFSVEEDNGKSLVYKAVNGCGETFNEFRPELDVKDCANFTITYSLDKKQVCKGDEVVLTATITNNSDSELRDVILSQSWDGSQIPSKDAAGTNKKIFVTSGDVSSVYDEDNNLWKIETFTAHKSATLKITFSAQEDESFHIYMKESNGVGYSDDINNPASETASLDVLDISDPVALYNAKNYNGICPKETPQTISLSSLVEYNTTDILYYYDKDKNQLTVEPTFDESVSTLLPKIYYIKRKENGKCISDQYTEVTINIYQKPSVLATPASATINCTSPKATITASGASTYTWKDNIGNTISSTSTDGSSILAEKKGATTTYTVVGTSEYECASDPVSVTVDENFTTPTLKTKNYVIDSNTGNEVSTTTLTCTNTEITLFVESTNSTATNDVSYNWYLDKLPEEGESVTPIQTGTTYPVTTEGKYVVQAVGGNGCTQDYVFTITEDNDNPIVSINSKDTITCDEPSIILTASSTVSNYKWYNESGVEIGDGATYTATTEGKYKVVATADNGCTGTGTKLIEERTTLPTVTINSNENKVTCKPNTLTASGAITYVWSTSEINQSIEVTSGGSYTVIGKNRYGCEATGTIVLTEDKQAPSISLTADDTSLTCTKETAVLTAEVTNADASRNYSYKWEKDGVSVSETSNQLDANAQATYKVTITDETNACTNSETINIKENKNYPKVETKPLDAVCLPATVDIKTAVVSTNADEVKYYADAALTQELTDTNVEATANAIYYVVGYEIQNNGCVGEAVEIPLSVKPVSKTPVVNNYDECAVVGTKTLSSLVVSDTTSLVFFADETSTQPIANLFDTSLENTTTSYWVTNTEVNACESERVEFQVNISGYVDFLVETPQTRVPAGQDVTFVITPLTETPVEEYVWYRGEEVVKSDAELELTEQLYLDTEYKVQAIGRCNSPSKDIAVEAIWPTAFTPHNANGKNDDFAKGMPIIVFNRFYTKIYEGPDGWDGSINGTMNESESIAVPGVYYYSVQLPNGEVKKGTIEIVR